LTGKRAKHQNEICTEGAGGGGRGDKQSYSRCWSTAMIQGIESILKRYSYRI